MINKNKTRNYLLYAIGEIILVVIGILIALQVNNWNEDRKRLKEREILIVAMKKDFLSTQHTLQDKILQQDSLNSYMRLFLNMIRTNDQTISLDSAQTLFSSFFITIPFQPVLSSLNEAESSGTYKLLNNDSLSRSIAEFKSYYEDFKLLNTISHQNAFLGPGWEFRKTFGFLTDISGDTSTISREEFMAIVSTNEAKAHLEGWEVWSRNIDFRFNGMNTALTNILKTIESMEKEYD